MKNMTGLYKHQRDNQGRRRKIPRVAVKAKLVPAAKYAYELERERVKEMYDDADKLAEQHDGDNGGSA